MTSGKHIDSELPKSVMIFGCGYVGSALAAALMDRGIVVGALTRNATRAAELSAAGVSEVMAAELSSTQWLGQIEGRYEAVVNCVSSAGGGLAGYRKSYVEGQKRILEWARSQRLRQIIYTSSTSVYPQGGGALVDEDADTSAAPSTGQVLLDSERLIEAHAALFDAWYVFRLAGIYGPGRHFLLNQLTQANGPVPGHGDYRMNMIHLDDIISAILAGLSGRAPSGIYNICDDLPETKERVLAYLATQLGLPKPDFDPTHIPPRLQRRGGRMPDRSILNRKAKKHLKWQATYPSYREGYASLLGR